MFLSGLKEFRPFCRRYQRSLSPYLDGELERTAEERMKAHLDKCSSCRTQYENMRFAARVVATVSLPESLPESQWLGPKASSPSTSPARRRPELILAPVLGIVALALVCVWYFVRTPPASWEVVRLSGNPAIGTQLVARSARLRAGEWLETDSLSRAMILMGPLGQVEVDPRSRVRLLNC